MHPQINSVKTFGRTSVYGPEGDRFPNENNPEKILLHRHKEAQNLHLRLIDNDASADVRKLERKEPSDHLA
jgi:hypothetical protein